MTKPGAWASERAVLEKELANLKANLAARGVPDPSRVRGQGKDGLATSTLNSYREIEHALKKLEAGSYGSCEGCRKPIAKDRLKAMPAARFCFACAMKVESAAATPDEATAEHQVEDKTELGIPAFGPDDDEDDAHTVQTDVSRVRGGEED